MKYTETMRILLDTLDDGGCTIARGKKVTYANGYQLCPAESREIRLPAPVTLEDITATARILHTIIDAYDLRSFGIWSDNNVLVIDTISLHIEGKQEALTLAEQAGQKAIFDWSQMSTIYL